MKVLNKDNDALQKAVADTAAANGELENHLRALSNVQDELAHAVVSQHTGQATYNALGDAFTKGKSLSATLQTIVDTLHQAGVKMDTSDLDGGAKILAHDGSDGHTDTGPWAGNAAVAHNLKVDVTAL